MSAGPGTLAGYGEGMRHLTITTAGVTDPLPDIGELPDDPDHPRVAQAHVQGDVTAPSDRYLTARRFDIINPGCSSPSSKSVPTRSA